MNKIKILLFLSAIRLLLILIFILFGNKFKFYKYYFYKYIINLFIKSNNLIILNKKVIQNINTGYKTAHFLIQQDQDDNGKYIFIGNINYHIDDEIHSTIDEYFSSSPNTYYSTEQLLSLIDNQYISLFCDIFDDDNYYNDSYNDSYNSYFENQNIDNTYNFIEYNDENEEDNYSENSENYISGPYEINESYETNVSNERG